MRIRFHSLLKFGALVWALVVVLLAISVTASAKSLDAYIWRNRLLFVIAPDAADPDVVEKLATLKQQTDRLMDRDILVFQIYLRGTSFFQDESLSIRAAGGPVTGKSSARVNIKLLISPFKLSGSEMVATRPESGSTCSKANV